MEGQGEWWRESKQEGGRIKQETPRGRVRQINRDKRKGWRERQRGMREIRRDARTKANERHTVGAGGRGGGLLLRGKVGKWG